MEGAAFSRELKTKAGIICEPEEGVTVKREPFLRVLGNEHLTDLVSASGNGPFDLCLLFNSLYG